MPDDATPLPIPETLLEEQETLLLKGFDNMNDADFTRVRELSELINPGRKSAIERYLKESPSGAGPSKPR
jgi:hypothetical protein